MTPTRAAARRPALAEDMGTSEPLPRRVVPVGLRSPCLCSSVVAPEAPAAPAIRSEAPPARVGARSS